MTNPERFAPLHDAAEALLDSLVREFRVERDEVDEPADDYRWGAMPRRTVRLRPDSPDSAPLHVTFTEFPGVLVRFGLRHHTVYPTCGCDACDESPAEEAQRMRDDVERLVTASYSERITIPPLGKARVTDSFRYADSRFWSEGAMERSVARSLEREGRASREWQPWVRR